MASWSGFLNKVGHGVVQLRRSKHCILRFALGCTGRDTAGINSTDDLSDDDGIPNVRGMSFEIYFFLRCDFVRTCIGSRVRLSDFILHDFPHWHAGEPRISKWNLGTVIICNFDHYVFINFSFSVIPKEFANANPKLQVPQCSERLRQVLREITLRSELLSTANN